MNTWELEELDVGDSIIGFCNRWFDEFPVVSLGPVFRRQGADTVSRNVSVRCGNHVITELVRSGGPEIRAVAGRLWSMG